MPEGRVTLNVLSIRSSYEQLLLGKLQLTEADYYVNRPRRACVEYQAADIPETRDEQYIPPDTMTDPQGDGWATMKSRALDKAWTLNTVQERHLQHHIDTIDRHIRMKRTKLYVLAANTKEFFNSINPTPGKNVVCPFGLSRDQAANFRQIKRGKLPSMSLDEFDQKLMVAKQTINEERNASKHIHSNQRDRDRKLCEYKIKRTLFKASDNASKSTHVTSEILVLAEDNVSTSFPLYRRKLVAAAAYNRHVTSSARTRTESGNKRSWTDANLQPVLPRIRANRSA